MQQGMIRERGSHKSQTTNEIEKEKKQEKLRRMLWGLGGTRAWTVRRPRHRIIIGSYTGRLIAGTDGCKVLLGCIPSVGILREKLSSKRSGGHRSERSHSAHRSHGVHPVHSHHPRHSPHGRRTAHHRGRRAHSWCMGATDIRAHHRSSLRKRHHSLSISLRRRLLSCHHL